MNTRFIITTILAVFLFTLILPANGYASSVVKMEFESIVNRADFILSGKIVNVENRVMEKDGKKTASTYITVSLTDKMKGNYTADVYTFKTAGGKIPSENVEYRVGGVPKFIEGQEVFLFLKDKKSLYSPIVGLNQGLYYVVTDKKNGGKYVKNHLGHTLNESHLGGEDKSSNEPLSYEVFKKKVQDIIDKNK